MRKNEGQLIRLLISAILLAIGMVLPLLLGQVKVLGQAISPLHIPVFICGMTCGPVYGAAMGFVLPLLRSAVFGMPPIIPTGLAMAFELCAYGALTGVLYPMLRRRAGGAKASGLPAMLVSLLIAMVLGRLVGGAAQAIILGFNGKGYTFQAFVASYFVGTAVGAVIHLIVVPAVVLALEKAKLSPMKG